MSELPSSKERTIEDASRSSAFWKAETIAANDHIRKLREALIHVLDVVSPHDKDRCAACQRASRLITEEYSPDETKAEPDIALDKDGPYCDEHLTDVRAWCVECMTCTAERKGNAVEPRETTDLRSQEAFRLINAATYYVPRERRLYKDMVSWLDNASLAEIPPEELPEELRRVEPRETTARIGPADPDNDMVICPTCTSQFRAIPVNVQTKLTDAETFKRSIRIALEMWPEESPEASFNRTQPVTSKNQLEEIRKRDADSAATWFKVPALGACGSAFIDRRWLLGESLSGWMCTKHGVINGPDCDKCR